MPPKVVSSRTKRPNARNLGEFVQGKYREAQEAMLDGRVGEAAQAFRVVAELIPANVDIANRVGLLAWTLKDTETAKRALTLYLEKFPDDPDALYNVGKFHQDTGSTDEAIAYYQASIVASLAKLGKTHDLSLVNLALCYSEKGFTDEARFVVDEALSIDTDNPVALYNRSFLKLAHGDPSGWQEFERRFECEFYNIEHERRDITLPRWTGERLWTGARLLLHSEQGFGDIIQFARFVPAVRAMMPDVHMRIEVPRTLVRLFRSAWPDADIVVRGEPFGDCDVAASFLSLPAITGLKFNELPDPVPFGRVESSVGPATMTLPRIGLCWAGSSAHPNDARRSMRAEHVRDLVRAVPGVAWYSLQVGDRACDLRDAELADRTVFFDAPRVGDFGDTAERMRSLDLVVTVDTAVAHLAGTLGIPTLLLVTEPAEWRWMTDVSTTPWYPSVRLVRQTAGGGWPSAIARVVHLLTSPEVNAA